MADVKLTALDQDDLNVVSTHCQDAIVRFGDIAWLPRERRLALVCNRFDWAAAQATPGVRTRSRTFERRIAGLRFDHVSRVRFKGIDPAQANRALVLLSMGFTATTAPAGHVTLVFADDAAIQLDVDCIEAELRDMGAAWGTAHRPDHVSAVPPNSED